MLMLSSKTFSTIVIGGEFQPLYLAAVTFHKLDDEICLNI